MKKKIIISTIIAVVIIAGGIFWWGRIELPEEDFVETTRILPEEYTIKETSEGKIIENEKEGLKVKMPEGWSIENLGYLTFFSPDFELDPTANNAMKRGCHIEIGIEKYKKSDPELITDAEIVKERIEMCKIDPEKLKEHGYELVEVAHHQALKIVENANPEIGKYIFIKVPIGSNIMYIFNTPLYSEDKERCEQEFNKFLETVSIK